MHKFVLCLAVACCAAVAYAQETGPGARLGTKADAGRQPAGDKPASNANLERARRTFQAADKNNDARIELAELEAGRLRVSSEEFRQRDLDANGAWNRDEFVLWYRGLLLKSGQRPASDLEAEATRLLAQQRAKATPVAAGEPQDPVVVDLEARLQRALDHLEQQAAARQATREDFNAVRQAWEARLAATRPTGADEAAQATLRQKVGRALDDLERRARDGQATREEYAQLRQALLTRARGVAAPAASTVEGEASLEARFAQALDELEQKALARQATREQFGAVRELLAARARRAAKAEGLDEVAATQLEQDYERALARLEERAKAGQVTRAEFAELRATLVARARRAANGPQAGPAPAAGLPAEGQARAPGQVPVAPTIPASTSEATAAPGRVAPAAPAPAPVDEGRRARAGQPSVAPAAGPEVAAPGAVPATDGAATGAATAGGAGTGTAGRGTTGTGTTGTGTAGAGRGAKPAEKVEPAPAPAPAPTPAPAAGGDGARPAPQGRPAPQPKPDGARGG